MLSQAIQQAADAYNRGDWVKAEQLCNLVLNTESDNFDALSYLGIMAAQTGRLTEAAELLQRAVTAQPRNAILHCNYGNLLIELKRFDAAVMSCDRALAIKPDFAEAHFNRGIALQKLKQLGAAIASFERAIAIKTDYADAYYNRGIALQELDRPVSAVESYDHAIALKPVFADAYYNRGLALQELKHLDAAGESYDRAIAIKPDYAEAYCNRGVVQQELRHLDAAVDSYDHAIAIKPNYADAHWNKSLALLLGGNFTEGLELYEWRWKTEKIGLKQRNFAQPLWLGNESLKDKTILLYGEQGLGDTIQFCRFAKLVADLGARVIAEVPKSLMELLRGLEGVSSWIEEGGALPLFDYHCPWLSLPLAFKTTLGTIPTASPYLRSDSHKVELWANKLGQKKMPRIGIVWSGNSNFKSDSKRSLALNQFLDALPESGLEFLCLQKEIKNIDADLLASRRDIKYFGEELENFSDTAALIECVDIVVSTCTSVPHLSCAMGKPTWILLSHVPDWRWMLDRNDSPWYPSATLYRQEKIGDWPGVLKRVHADLIKKFN